jgi:hypothetical protein
METHTLPPSVTSVAVIVALAVTTTAHAATPHDGDTDMLVVDPSHNSAFSQQVCLSHLSSSLPTCMDILHDRV